MLPQKPELWKVHEAVRISFIRLLKLNFDLQFEIKLPALLFFAEMYLSGNTGWVAIIRWNFQNTEIFQKLIL